LSQVFTSAHLEWVLQALAEAQADMRLSTHPRLTLEVALARASNLEVRETQTVVARLERLERALLQGGSPARGAPSAAPSATKPAAPRAKATTPSPVKEGPNVPKKRPAEVAPAPVAGTLEEQWEAVLEAVRTRSRVTHTHLREGWPIELSDDSLTVAFEKEFHATELERRPDHIERITGALEGIFGRKLRLETAVRPGERPSTNAVEEDAGSPDDSPVDLVRKGLGAEVVEEVTRS
jgi:DNA polymerase III gamma/tau subunit